MHLIPTDFLDMHSVSCMRLKYGMYNHPRIFQNTIPNAKSFPAIAVINLIQRGKTRIIQWKLLTVKSAGKP